MKSENASRKKQLNTNLIASAIENVVIGCTEFVPIKIENAEDTLKEKCADALQEKYGDTVSNFIRESLLYK